MVCQRLEPALTEFINTLKGRESMDKQKLIKTVHFYDTTFTFQFKNYLLHVTKRTFFWPQDFFQGQRDHFVAQLFQPNHNWSNLQSWISLILSYTMHVLFLCNKSFSWQTLSETSKFRLQVLHELLFRLRFFYLLMMSSTDIDWISEVTSTCHLSLGSFGCCKWAGYDVVQVVHRG